MATDIESVFNAHVYIFRTIRVIICIAVVCYMLAYVATAELACPLLHRSALIVLNS